MSYSYRAYGFLISSDIAIPGLDDLKAVEVPPDLSFEASSEPKWVSDARKLPSHCFHKQLAEPTTHEPDLIVTALGEGDFFELEYSDGVRLVLDKAARRMWGQWTPSLTVEDFATYFLGPVMGFVLRRRGVTALHASSINVSGHAVILSGDAHAGKSTTAAALALRGVSVLCEDISALNENGESFFWVESGYPRICLWPDSVRKLMGAEDALPRLTPTWEKCYLALDGVRARFEPQKRPLGALYLFGPRADQGNAPRIEELTPRDALLELVQNTYMNWILDRKQRAAEFDVLARIVATTPVRRVVAHCDAAKIGNLCELLISDAEQLVSGNGSAGSFRLLKCIH